MGHRHVFSPSYMFETENDQRWNLTEHPYAHIAQSGAVESSSLTYPADNMSIDGAQYASHCNPAPVSSTYSSLAHDAQNPHYRQDAAGPSDLPTDPSSAGGFYMVPENYRNSASSSNYNEHPVHEDDSFDIRVSNGRWQSKRKSPGVPVGYERDGTNRYNNDAGSSSDISMPADPWEETPNMDFLHTPWDYPAVNPSHGGTSLTIGGESSLRNVRSRAALDLEGNLVGTPSTNNLSHDYYTTSRPMDVSSLGHLMGQRSQGSMREWNPTQISNSVHDGSSLDQELNPFLMGSSNPNTPVEIGGYNGLITGSNHVPQNFQGTSAQSVRGIRSNHIQRSGPTFRASSSSMRLGHAVASDEGLQLATGSYSSRHPRPLSTIAWRSGDRNGRARMSIDRHRSFPEEANFRDRAVPGGLMIVDRSAFYGSRNPFDHHRDMRLDIDDMSYEELLALGERIGSVSTGLSEDLISKCLTESIYCSSDQIQEEGACVICLEEYANMDDVGILKGCRHDFHVGCIKKWLLMKNLCPICKAEPMKQK